MGPPLKAAENPYVLLPHALLFLLASMGPPLKAAENERVRDVELVNGEALQWGRR